MDNYSLIFVGFIVIYLLVIWKSGKTYPILYLFTLTYFLQYIFSTYLVYNQYPEIGVQMAVKQDPYFNYAIPALLFLFAGVFLFNKDLKIKDALRKIDPQQASRLGYLLLFISYFFDVLPLIGINAFVSLISFTQYLKYLAAFCFLFSNSTFTYILSGLIYLHLAIFVLTQGVFIDFIIWSTYLFFFIALKFRLSFLMRASFIVIALPILIIIQSVKEDYRKATWKKGEEAGLTLFTELAKKKTQENENTPISETEGVVNTISRLNEGWHLGLTLRHVPKRQPFVDGKEMLNDMVSALLPRVIFANKKVVHTKEKFYQFTGRKLRGTTAMTIGLLGDFYVNFGRWGSYIMLFIFGAFVAKMVYYFLKRFVLPDPINIIWVPFILSYLIRADNDFYIFFNCLIKGFLIFFAVNYIRYRWLGAQKLRIKVTKPVYS